MPQICPPFPIARPSRVPSGFFASLLILLSLLAPACPAAPAPDSAPQGRFMYRSYGAEQGLANVSVVRLLQDREGFIWASTDDGLFRYDGYRFDAFGLKEGLLSTSIDALFEDASGVLWVGTHEGLSRRDGQRFTPVGVASGLPETAITGLAQSPAGLLVTTPQGPFVGAINARFAPMPGWPGGEATAVLRTRKSPTTWVARWTGSAVMMAQRDGHWQEVASPATRPNERIDAIAEDADGAIWARTATSLWLLDPDGSHFELVPTPIPLVSSRGYLYTSKRGELYVSSDQALLHRVAGQWQVFSPATGLPDGSRPVLEDREGSLWIGSVGLNRLLGGGAFHAFTRAEGLPYDAIWSVFRDSAKRLWVGTGHGLALWDGTRFRTIAGTENNTIRSIVEGRDGTLYLAGVPGKEILSYQPASALLARHLLRESDPTKRIFRLMMGRDATLWASTDGAGLFRADSLQPGLRFAPVTLPSGDPKEFMSDVREDAQGRVWVAGRNGLAMLENGTWRRFTTRDGLRRNYIAYALPLSGGDLLLPYFEPLGVTRARYANGALSILGQYDFDTTGTADKVFLAGEDALHRLWIGGGKGIDLVTPEGSRHFGAADGIVGEDTSSMAFLAEPGGDAWFGTSKGLVRFDQKAFAALPPRQAPTTALIGISIGGASYLPDARDIRVPYDNILEVHFAGLSFVGEGQIQYRERLVGREQAFNITDSREARYSALPAGHYRFEVAARIGAHGAWGPTSLFGFEVLPAWWQSWWLRALGTIAAALALLLAFRWRLARMQRENLRLEGLVEARTGDLRVSNAALQVANAALQESSMVDPLTGLKNRRYLNAFMPGELARTMRLRGTSSGERNIDLCVFMVDLDHFKAVNDEHGHGAGDNVLRQVATVLRDNCRASDVVVRWGGEEFLLVARNIDRSQAGVLASELCAAVRAHPFDTGNGLILAKTCSLGFTAFPMLPGAPDRFDWEQAVELADQCMYAAKKTGRDGWVGCLMQDDAAMPGLRDMPGYGACLVSSSWPQGFPLQW